jgi:WD40 repeat protein
MKWDIITTILRNYCLHDIIGHIGPLKNKTLLRKLLQQKHSNIRFTRCIKTINYHRNLNCILQLRDGRILTGSNTLCVWDGNTFELLNTIDDSEHITHILQINERVIVTASLKCKFDFWKIENNNFKMLAKFKATYYIYCMLLIDCNTLAYGDLGYVYLVDISMKKIINSLFENSCAVALMKIDNFLITVSYEGVLRLRNINKNFLFVKEVYEGKKVLSIAQVSNKHFATGSIDNKIRIYEWVLNNVLNIKTIELLSINVTSLIVLKDGRLVGGSEQGQIIIWGPGGEDKSVLEKSNSCDSIAQVIQLKDGRIISISKSKTINIWS